MPPSLALFLWFILLVALLRFDPAKDSGTSLALWVPVTWMFILGTRLPSQWLGGQVGQPRHRRALPTWRIPDRQLPDHLQKSQALFQLRARLAADPGNNLPGLRLRIHKTRESCEIGAQGAEGYVDMAFDETVDARVPCEVSG